MWVGLYSLSDMSVQGYSRSLSVKTENKQVLFQLQVKNKHTCIISGQFRWVLIYSVKSEWFPNITKTITETSF